MTNLTLGSLSNSPNDPERQTLWCHFTDKKTETQGKKLTEVS